jgi:prepilin-type N-terminal cleavage/methylation domain-containing protein
MSAVMTRVRARVARLRSDAGVSLMELIVSMALFSILGTLTLTLFLNVDTSSAAITDRTLSTANARNAIQSWTAYLRVADGTTAGVKTNRIEWLSDKDMLFYADVNNRSMSSLGTTSAPTMMWLRLDAAGQLVEEQFTSTAKIGAKPTVCRILASKVSQAVNTDGATQSVFSGLDINGNVLGGLGTAPTASAGCQVLPVTVPSQTSNPNAAVQAALANVRSVNIDFQMVGTRGTHPIEFTSQAVLPNLGSTS